MYCANIYIYTIYIYISSFLHSIGLISHLRTTDFQFFGIKHPSLGSSSCFSTTLPVSMASSSTSVEPPDPGKCRHFVKGWLSTNGEEWNSIGIILWMLFFNIENCKTCWVLMRYITLIAHWHRWSGLSCTFCWPKWLDEYMQMWQGDCILLCKVRSFPVSKKKQCLHRDPGSMAHF